MSLRDSAIREMMNAMGERPGVTPADHRDAELALDGLLQWLRDNLSLRIDNEVGVGTLSAFYIEEVVQMLAYGGEETQ